MTESVNASPRTPYPSVGERTRRAAACLAAILLFARGSTLCAQIDAGPDAVAEIGARVALRGTALPAAGETIREIRWEQVREPSSRERLSRLECPPNRAENYGTRIRGYLVPRQSGTYRFHLASDDASRLLLSPSADPAARRAVAEVRGWTAPRSWSEQPSQTSDPIALEAGTPYCFEVLHKEGGGGDHLAVAWSRDGAPPSIIPGSDLAEFTPDGPGNPGDVVCEVWNGVSGGELDDLLRSPRYPEGPAVSPDPPDALDSGFVPTTPGAYRFRLTVRTDARSLTDEVEVRVTEALRDGQFDAEAAADTGPWQPRGVGPGRTVTREPDGGVDGSACIRLQIEDAAGPGQVEWVRRMELAPYTPYLLTGAIRVEEGKATGDHVATIGIDGLWLTENGPPAGTKASEWQRFEVDFATGPSGSVTVACKLGSYGDGSTGTVRFDDLTLVRNPKVETFTGQHFVLHLYDDQVKLATRDGVARMMRYVDDVCEAFTELTGYTPDETSPQSAWAPDKWNIKALGWSGNPTLWTGNREWIAAQWPREGYCAEVFLHELAHNWDHPSWTFHGHFNELKMFYALETLNLAIAEDGWNRGPNTRHRWELRSRRNREIGVIDEVVQVYKNILLKDEIGWEPFKRTYRRFLSLPPEEVPATPWGKFKLWHDLLTDYSGTDAWAIYTPEELEFVKYYYAPRAASRPLAQTTDDTAPGEQVDLGAVTWDEASVGWEQPKSGFFPSGGKLHLSALYAHAPSRYSYTPNGAWSRLQTAYGLRRGHAGSVVFVVRGDGRELFRSEVVRDEAERTLDVPLKGVERLELVVEDGGDGPNSDHGIWFSPVLIR